MTPKKTQSQACSQELFAEAKRLFPGGVNSPVRAFASVGGQPLFFRKGEGAYLWDVDGNRFIDYVGSWGPAIAGHAHPEVVAAVCSAAANGLSFGAPTVGENRLAQKIAQIMPHIEMMRFVSSGTEACMSALRVARAFTGRDHILKFDGCYHGHADMLLVKAGSGVATLGIPGTPGIPAATAAHTIVAPYNDLEALSVIFKQRPGQIAAIIVEPIVGNAGFIRPLPGFLDGLRSLCDKEGALLIFDEVMTGFRVALQGAQGLFGIKPDLTTLGKVIGGGMPLAAYGGRRDIMERVAPQGDVYQAGTLSGNPLATACGLKTLEIIAEHGRFDELTHQTRFLAEGLVQTARDAKIDLSADAQGGMFGFFFTREKVHNFSDALRSDKAMFVRFFRGMLAEGIYLAPSPFEAGFVSMAHTIEHIEQTLTAASRVFGAIRPHT